MNPEIQIQRLKKELQLANAEIARLRRKLPAPKPHEKRIETAWADALLLAEYHVAHQDTSRRHAYTFAGMTNHRWESAQALLRLARVHNGRRWLAHDLATIADGLDRARKQALETPEAFRARLPRHARGVKRPERLTP